MKHTCYTFILQWRCDNYDTIMNASQYNNATGPVANMNCPIVQQKHVYYTPPANTGKSITGMLPVTNLLYYCF